MGSSGGGGGQVVKLLPPTNTSISQTDEQITIKWTDPDDVIVGTTTYAEWTKTVIVRKENSAPLSYRDGKLMKTETTRGSHTFVDDTVKNDIRYFYGVFPCAGSSTYTYDCVLDEIARPIYPSKATNISIQNFDEEFSVSWEMPSDAIASQVGYKLPSESEYTFSADVTSPTTIYVPANTTYDVVVKTFNAKRRPMLSDVVNANPYNIYPVKATNVSAVSGDEEFTVSWKISDASVSTKVGYKLTSESEYIYTNAVSSPYTVRDISNGEYDVVIMSGNSKRNAITNPIKTTPKAIYPSKVTDISIKAGDGFATITWTKPSDATRCQIGYKLVNDAEYIFTDDVTSPHTITGLMNDEIYNLVVKTINAKGRETISDSIQFEKVSLKIVTFANGTDEEIAEMLKAHYNDEIDIRDYWSVGDVRNVSLSNMSAEGVDESHQAQTVQMVIYDFEHDDLVTPINEHTKAAITIGQKNCLNSTGYINRSNSNYGGWTNCARRDWCNNVYKASVPIGLRNLIKTVKKKTSIGRASSTIGTSEDDVFLLAEIEIFETIKNTFEGEGYQYKYFENLSNIPKQVNGIYDIWWGRSPSAGGATTNYFIIMANGTSNAASSGSSRGIAPAFAM